MCYLYDYMNLLLPLLHIHVTINIKQIYPVHVHHQQLRQKFRKDHCTGIKDATNTAHLRVLTVHALLYLISCREELSEICCVRHHF